MSTTTPTRSRAARPQRAAAPALPTMDALDATHRDVMKTLQRMADWVERLASDGLDAGTRTTAREISDFFDGRAREHHAAEERYVFPDLLTSGDAELVHHVRRLQQDHGWLEEDWLELQPQLRAVVDGYSDYDIDFLRAAVPVFTELYREHIALEEDIVYPARRRQG